MRRLNVLQAIVALLALLLASCEDAPGTLKVVGWPEVSFVPIASDISKPTHIAHSDDGSGALFVTEQKGRIVAIRNGITSDKPFLNISEKVSCCGERGLLSVAFPPYFKNNRHFFVNYTDRSGDTVVARYNVSSVSGVADPKSEEIILRVKQPYSNHNGGQIAFGPDGYLYIGMGDGGYGGDPHGYGQKPDALLGKMLRIDVASGEAPYVVP